MIALANQGALLAVAHSALTAARKDTTAIQKLREQQAGLEVWAKDPLDGDLHDLHTSGVISLWTSLKAAIEDTAVLVLMRDQTSLPLLAALGVRLPANLSQPLTEPDARVFS